MWVITIPKTIAWSEYQKELDAVADRSQDMNYRVRHFPSDLEVGDRCYVVHDGQVRGWMLITGLVDAPKPWRCTTSGQTWPAGKYIQRSGKFHAVSGIPMTGFRGIRRFTPPNPNPKD